MHSTQGPNGTTFHHNGDFSGLVKFSALLSNGGGQNVDVEVPFALFARAANRAGYWTSIEARREDNDKRCTVEVPLADLRALVATRVRGDRIRALEEMEYDELFASAVTSEVRAWADECADWD